MGIRAQWSRSWTITTKDSDFSIELQSILGEQFNFGCPNAVWYSNIIYIRIIGGFVFPDQRYRFIFREIIDWIFSEILEVCCVIDTINKAKVRRNINRPLIVHSGRDSQYAAKKYMKATENIQRSYFKKAFSWDNACIEFLHIYF